MRILSCSELKDTVYYFGRIIEDKQLEANFFNWTCSGFEIEFIGTYLEVELLAFGSDNVPPETGKNWPWVGLFIDDEEEPVNRFEACKEKDWYTLFKSEVAEKHKIKIVKLSENSMGKVGMAKFKLEGEIAAPLKKSPSFKLEFIGDSITCGYGNEVEDRDAPFLTKEENGWNTYGAITSRLLNAEYHIVSMSGISVSKGSIENMPLAMDEVYEYTDRLYEERIGKSSDFQKWDFTSYVPDAIIINLGTNDVNAVKLATDKKTEEQLFEENYMRFLKNVRRLNGPEAIICCTLGPLDYYLYDNIHMVVDSYKQQTKDSRIHSFKYGGVIQWEEGVGAVGHPTAKTHLRMSKELSFRLSELLNS